MRKTKYEIVKKYVDELDYMGFLSGGCPKDEYDCESKRIADWIKLDMSVNEISRIIEAVFYHSFFTGVDLSDPSDPKIIDFGKEEGIKEQLSEEDYRPIWIAQKIYDELHK